MGEEFFKSEKQIIKNNKCTSERNKNNKKLHNKKTLENKQQSYIHGFDPPSQKSMDLRLRILINI